MVEIEAVAAEQSEVDRFLPLFHGVEQLLQHLPLEVGLEVLLQGPSRHIRGNHHISLPLDGDAPGYVLLPLRPGEESDGLRTHLDLDTYRRVGCCPGDGGDVFPFKEMGPGKSAQEAGDIPSRDKNICPVRQDLSLKIGARKIEGVVRLGPEGSGT